MATKFLDYTGLSYLWDKIKGWCNSIFVTKATDENITGTKTFIGSKKIAFKQSGANDKLGFTLFNNSGKEQGYLEYNPTNKIAGIPLMMLGNYATAADELTYVGFRRYSNISGASGAYNLLTPLISDAKTPFNLTTTYTNFYLPLGISDGTNIVKASNSGVVDISSLLTLTGYTKPNSGSALATTDTIKQALGKLEAKVDTAVASSDGIPVGSVVWLSTSTVPTGFLLCNGQAVGRATYPDLFSAIGTTYGEGDGSTTFNLPNLIDKFIEGTNNNVGTSVSAGLPNITGSFGCTVPGSHGNTARGVFSGISYAAGSVDATATNGTSAPNSTIWGYDIDASRSSSIYGNSITVQPPALKLLPCIKAYNSISNISELDAAQLENELQNNYVHKSLLGINNGALVPVGAIIYYAKSTVPGGFLICNGSAVSRTAYAILFNIIGTTYGTGDGSTTFNVPNLIDKFPQGNATPGTVKAAGLPDITGWFRARPNAGSGLSGSLISAGGSFELALKAAGSSTSQPVTVSGSKISNDQATFDASRSSAIYGNSATVQPPALTLVPCIRYA